ncbi:MAG: aminotransferase class V-fold PLP-dependent enzyme, partial [Bacillota bacterium]|nr:aminotransferase class V-fold PLP-dependent enzyme [Bacillota bacterium]
MIYLDNAAGSSPKAPGLGKTIAQALDCGAANINRAVNAAAAHMEIDIIGIRERIAAFFACPDPRYLIFTSGVTMSLNMIIKGLLLPGDHLLISGMEHNAVWRPARQMQAAGVALDVAPCDVQGRLKLEDLEKLFRPETKLMLLCHASNVCGTIQDAAAVAKLCHAHGVPLVLDCAQTAGHIPLDMQALGVDAICFTGHKGLLGPQGSGGIAFLPELAERIEPLIAGGTGSRSDSGDMPPFFPDHLEAGTMNIPGILGLGHSLSFVQAQGLESLFRHEMELTRLLL